MTEGNNIVSAIASTIPTMVTAARSGATVVVTAVTGGTSGNSIVFNNINASNFAMNGSGFLGGTRMGDNTGSLRYWEGNNSGGFSRCVFNCTAVRRDLVNLGRRLVWRHSVFRSAG